MSKFLEDLGGQLVSNNGKICIVKIEIEKVEDVDVSVQRKSDNDYVPPNLHPNVSIIVTKTIM